MSELKYKRVIIKVSGEALAGAAGRGINNDVLCTIADNIKKLCEMGMEIAIVVGGGNFWRGKTSVGMDRSTADHIGMLATVMNALAMQDSLEARGLQVRVQTAIEMRQIAEPYVRRRAVRHLEKGRVVIFACGTGNPFFTTDTTVALRGAEIDAEAIFMAKNIDGVYSADPRTNPEAVKYDKLKYMDVISKELGVMDATSVTLCKENNIPIIVFGIDHPDNLVKIALGDTSVGTIIE